METLADTVDQLIALPEQAGIHILKAPPGEGKTRLTIAALCQAVEAKRYSQVLWAVRQTVDKEGEGFSLAQETKQAFEQLSGGALSPRIILGKDQFSEDEQQLYREQFIWDVPVLIISHAHLPLIYHSAPTPNMQTLSTAQIVVIDEDPLNSLLLQSSSEGTLTPPLKLGALLTLLEQGSAPATDAYRHLASFAAGEDPHQQWAGSAQEGRQIGRKDAHRTLLRGPGFWSLMTPILQSIISSPGGYSALEDLLVKTFRRPGMDHTEHKRAQRDAEIVLRTLMHDLDQALTGKFTHRFGWEWKGAVHSKNRKNLHFDILKSVTNLPTTVILDAYADLSQYQQMFPTEKSQIHTVRSHDPGIQVHVAPTLRLDRTDLMQRRNRAKTQLTLEEISRDIERSCKSQLFIAPKKIWPLLRPYLEQNHLPLAPDQQVEYGHWYAGRGKNEYAGWDVRALLCPHLPTQYRDAHLSALYPYGDQHQQRTHLWQHHKQSELLQMLLRSRQLQAAPGSRPRIITHFLPCELCPSEEVKNCRARDPRHPSTCSRWAGILHLLPYQPAVLHKEDSRNPRYRQVLQDVARELLTCLPGLPLVALETIGLVRINAWGEIKMADLTGASQTLSGRKKSGNTPLLNAWQEHYLTHRPRFEDAPEYWERQHIQTSKDRNRAAILEVVLTDDLKLHRFRVKTQSRIRYTVYAKGPNAAKAAIKLLIPESRPRRAVRF